MTFALHTQFQVERPWGQCPFSIVSFNGFLNVEAVVAAFNQEKALVGAFSVITNLRIAFFWISSPHCLIICVHYCIQKCIIVLSLYSLLTLFYCLNLFSAGCLQCLGGDQAASGRQLSSSCKSSRDETGIWAKLRWPEAALAWNFVW